MLGSMGEQGLASGWSHDIRTHLNILLGAIGMLEAGRLKPDQQKEYVAMIRHNAHAMLRLVNHLLDENTEGCRSGKANLSNQQVDGLMRTVVKSITPYAANRRLELLHDIEAPLFVWCDVEMLERVLYNLLSNAVKYTDPGGFVYISAKARGTYVEINVSDTGRGMCAEQLEKICGEMETCREVGLGLTLVRGMVAAMRGRIRVTSRENVGTTFYLQFPAAESALSAKDWHHDGVARLELSNHVEPPSLAELSSLAMPS